MRADRCRAVAAALTATTLTATTLVAPATAQEAVRPLTLTVETVFMDRPARLSAHIDDLAAFLGGADEAVRIVLDGTALGSPIEGTLVTPSAAGMRDGSAPLEAEITWAGLAYLAADLSVDPAARSAEGRMDLNVASTEAMLDAFGIEIAGLAEGYPAPKLGARLDASPERIVLQGLRLTSEATTLTGDLALDRSGERPRLTGDLIADRLRLPPVDTPAPSSPFAPLRRFVEATPLPLDVALALTIEEAIVSRLDGLVLEDARWRFLADVTSTEVRLERTGVAEGEASASLGVDKAEAPARIAVSASGEGLALGALVRRIAGREASGTLDLSLDASARGDTPEALADALSGRLDLTAREGTIRGLDLPAFVADPVAFLVEGRPMRREGNEPVTPYERIALRVPIERGVATVETGRFASEPIVVTASGTVDLGARRLDLRVVPDARESLDERGGMIDLAGLGVPIAITGPITDPSIDVQYMEVLGGDGDGAPPERYDPDVPGPVEAEEPTGAGD